MTDRCAHGVMMNDEPFNCWRCRLSCWWFYSFGWLFDSEMRHYVFDDSAGRDIPRWQVWQGRLRSHPEGVVYYSTGYAPDMACKTCGDDLG